MLNFFLKFNMKQEFPENPVNPVKSRNLSDRIYRIDRMFSPFPDEKEKEPLPSANTTDGPF